jgi:hypothetical protein
LLLLSVVAAHHLQADAAADSLPFRRLLARDHSSDREDRSAATTNPTLIAAVKRLEVSHQLCAKLEPVGVLVQDAAKAKCTVSVKSTHHVKHGQCMNASSPHSRMYTLTVFTPVRLDFKP